MKSEVGLSIKSDGWLFILKDLESGYYYEIRLQLMDRRYEREVSPDLLINWTNYWTKWKWVVYTTVVAENDGTKESFAWQAADLEEGFELTSEENWLDLAQRSLEYHLRKGEGDKRLTRFERILLDE